MANTNSIQQQLCSLYSVQNGEKLGGTAPSWRACLFLELKEPWEKDIEKSRHFHKDTLSVLERVRSSGIEIRVQGVLPDPEYSVPGHTRIMYFSLTDNVSMFEKQEYVVSSANVAPLVEALLVDPNRLDCFEADRQAESGKRDIFVCTHGKYDVCCGRFGYLAYESLRTDYAPFKESNVRVWRASHLGGHRFAPNMIDMPEGNNWARMDPEELRTIILRDRPFSEVRHCYRGWIGLHSPEEQILEGEAFTREGWEWTERRVATLSDVQDVLDTSETVRVQYSSEDVGSFGSYQGLVKHVGNSPSIECISGSESTEYPKFNLCEVKKIK